MINKSLDSNRTSFREWLALNSETTQAWIVILVLVLITAVGIVGRVGSVVRIVYPAGCGLVGLFLYQRQPVLYLGFTWWTFFITPFLSRLVDLHSGWDAQRTMIVAPLLVTSICGMTFLRKFPQLYREGGSVFILPAASLFYSFAVSLLSRPSFEAIRGLQDWLSPILMGFHLYVNWRLYPQFRQNTQKTFLWGTLVMGIYGIFQYLVLPDWDKNWFIESKLADGQGQAEPMGFRVWSTMNSHGPFAATMSAALLVLLSCQGPLVAPAYVAGFLSFLLTFVRSNWGAWFVGLLTFFPLLRPRLQARLTILIVVLCLCIVPLATMEPFSERIIGRLSTLTDIQNDGSFRARQEITQTNLNYALSQVTGGGISTSATDSGIIEVMTQLGWIGTVVYMAGVVILLIKLLKIPEGAYDSFVGASRGICLGTVPLIWFGFPLRSITGMYFWAFAGLALAAHQYYQHQRASHYDEEE